MKSTTILALGLAASVNAQMQSSTSLPALYPSEKPTDSVITVTKSSSKTFTLFSFPPNSQPYTQHYTNTPVPATFTIPVWHPTTQLSYGAPGTTLPTDGPNQPSPTASASSGTESQSQSTAFSAPFRPVPSSSSASESPRSSTTTSPSESSTTSGAPAQQTPGAAYAMRPDIVGALAGGLMAGWALV
jgi:hypothetical protein